MKVIQINASYKPAFIYGGPTMSVSKLSEVLIQKATDLEVLTTLANGTQELNIHSGQQILVDKVPVTYYSRLTKDHTHFSPALYKGLWKKLDRLENDKNAVLVHIHTWWNLVSVICCFITILKNRTVVLSPRGTLSTYSFGNRNNFAKKILFKISKPLLTRCHFHATSENERQALSNLLLPKSITVIPNLVTLPPNVSNTTSITEPQEGIKFLFFSRIEQKKGLELLFLALQKCQFQYTLTIAGPGKNLYISYLKTLSKQLKISEKILWIGNQAPEHKFDIMSTYDILVLPSYDENFANVVIESLASGTAVLITQNVGLSDYVIKNDFGWVCKFEEKDLSSKLEMASNDFEKLKTIRQNAPQKIRNDFADDLVSQQYINMYNRILRNV